MKNILDQNNKQVIIKRINNLTPHLKALWGKMNVNEMLCHTADQIRMAVGIKKTDFVGNRFLTSVGKTLVLVGIPAPKGKVETVKELKQGIGGTKTTTYSEDKNMLIKLIEDFNNCYKEGMIIKHPAFGEMNKKQWSRLIYVHLDHHLKQFGV